MVNVLYDFGQQQFSCGNYGAAADLLYQFRILVCTRPELLGDRILMSVNSLRIPIRPAMLHGESSRVRS